MNETLTTNGMPALHSTLNDCVDLFFAIGASRGKNILPEFKSALLEDESTAIKIALWVRDIRGGSGEREIYRDILKYIGETRPSVAKLLIPKTIEIGRYDDLLCLIGTQVEAEVLAHIADELADGNALCAKWMPRKGPIANKLRKYLKQTPKEYRKKLVGLTNVVEQKMCAKKWNEIDFEKLPSVASARYQSAFKKNAPEEYGEYVKKLVTGEATINAGAVYPYDIIKSINYSDEVKVAEAQWDALPNYMEGSTEFVLPLVDVSGSMNTPAGGSHGTNTVSCMDVAVSLGLYISERNPKPFNDKFITFSRTPEMISLSGSLSKRCDAMKQSAWGMNTNIVKVFELILATAEMFSVDPAHMPTKILILSDMQFDGCIQGLSALDVIEHGYKTAGYKMPDIIFWNINSSGNVPTKFNKDGVALVSGFSPAIMKSILTCTNVTPINVMLETINVPRYNWN